MTVYPSEILPGVGKKFITCDLSDYYLQRFVFAENIESLFDPETHKPYLNQVCSPKKNIIDFSTALLGLFKPHFCGIAMVGVRASDYYSYCAPDENVPVPEYPADFNYQEGKLYLIFSVGMIQGKTFQYITGNNGEIEEVTCRVVHTPTKCNFWHFSFHWQTPIGLVTSPGAAGGRKIEQKVAHTVRIFISEISCVASPRGPILPAECYIQN